MNSFLKATFQVIVLIRIPILLYLMNDDQLNNISQEITLIAIKIILNCIYI